MNRRICNQDTERCLIQIIAEYWDHSPLQLLNFRYRLNYPPLQKPDMGKTHRKPITNSPLTHLVMSGLAKASSWQQTYGMCYVCFGFVYSEQACCGCFLRALWLLSTFSKTDSDRYAGMTSSCPVYGSETHIKPHKFLGSFLTVQWSRGVSCQ